MQPGTAILLTATLASTFNTALQYYSQVATYPLFAAIGPGFADYHRAYERRLSLAIYAPFALLMVTMIALVAVPPAGMGRGWPLAMLVLNLSIAPISILLAVPHHRRLTAQGLADAAGVGALLRANGLRLAVSTAASAIGIGLLAAGLC